MPEPTRGTVLAETIDLRATEWLPPRQGDPGFVGKRLLPTAFGVALTDWLVLVSAFVVVSRLRFGLHWPLVWDRTITGWIVAVPVYLSLVVGVGWLTGHYAFGGIDSPSFHPRRVARLLGWTAMVTLALLFVTDRDEVSRLFLIGYFPTVLAGMAGVRFTARGWSRRRRKAGKGVVNVLVIGSGPVATGIVAESTGHPEAGVNVVGFLDDGGGLLLDYPRLGTFGDLSIVLEHVVVDEVVVCLPLEEWGRIGAIAKIVEQQGKAIRIPIPLPGTINSRSRLDQLAGIPVLSLVSAPDRPMVAACKRTIDVVLTWGAQIVFAPVMAVIALAILVTEGRPVLFAQPRVGLNGRTFTLWKFRTMVTDAENRLSELADLNERRGPAFKVAKDPRVTRLGRVLRATSLDELPQLWNVFKGDMSLVGPRPPIPSEVEQYHPWHRRRLSMKPGMTGLWQVSNRNDSDFDSWVALDLEYIDSWSIYLDFRILFRTVTAVLKLTGK
ncbi:MAG: sugar transferase [Acidimicrobiia bacterium]